MTEASDFSPASMLAAMQRLTPATVPDWRERAPPNLGAQRAFDLRTRLAVRGWTNPHTLFDPADRDAAFDDALAVVAAEVETAADRHPGCWYMTVPCRRRVFGDRGNAAVLAELGCFRSGSDASDLIRSALREVLGLEPALPLADRSHAMIEALALARSWLGGDHDAPSHRAILNAERARRNRAVDVDRLTHREPIGDSHADALDALAAIAAAPFDAAGGMSISHVHGDGGGGKSTLLACLEQHIAALPIPPLLGRLDFDDRRLDSFDPFSLDLALFEQLCIAAPEAAETMTAPLAMLRELRRFRRDLRAEAGQRIRNPSTKRSSGAETFGNGISLVDERGTILEASARGSVLARLLDPDGPIVRRRPLILLLDTIEVASSRGTAAVVAILQWLGSLSQLMAAHDLRIVIAGRDDPRMPIIGSASLLDLQAREGYPVHQLIALTALTPTEAALLLNRAGVTDPVVAAAAAAVLPGNPLLLSIAAEILQGDPFLANEVRAAHARGAIDRHTAGAYLSRRIVAHLAVPAARPYLLATMFLPTVTAGMLQHIVIPEVDAAAAAVAGTRHDPVVSAAAPAVAPAVSAATAAQVFRAFASARWLTRSGLDDTQIDFQPTLRSFVRRLLAADPTMTELQHRIQLRAIAWHGRRRGPEHRSWRLYHQLMLGSPAATVDNPDEVLSILALVVNDLPAPVRNQLVGGDTATPRGIAVTEPDWRAFLEREGTRLVKRGNTAEALSLYYSRPPGAAPLPTFVIQALANAGNWHGDAVDVAEILDEFDTGRDQRLPDEMLTRLYWLTRFALLRDEGRLTVRHAGILRDAAARADLSGYSALPALVAVADAGRPVGTEPIMPPIWASPASLSRNPRLALVHGLATGLPQSLQIPLDVLHVVQREWASRFLHLAGNVIPDLDAIQAIIDRIEGGSYGALNLTIRDIRSHAPAVLDWRGDPALGILALRSLTTEFLRPLSSSIAGWLAAEDGERTLAPILVSVTNAMSLRPHELAPEALMPRLAADPEGWVAALIGFADRARLLPLVCEGLADLPGGSAAAVCCRTVARSFTAWDRLICGGGSSMWLGKGRTDAF